MRETNPFNMLGIAVRRFMKRSRQQRSFQQTKLYQAAMDAALQTGKILKSAPEHEEQLGLASDVLRASRKVCAGIAAGFVVRQNLELSLAHLEEAQGHATETGVLLDIAHKLGYLKASQCQPLVKSYEQLTQRLSRLIAYRQEQAIMGGGCGEGGCGHCPKDE
jgi:four helix bundle protein